MQGTPSFPIEEGAPDQIARLNDRVSIAIGEILARSLNVSVLAMVRITCKVASSALLALGFVSTQLEARSFRRAESSLGRPSSTAPLAVSAVSARSFAEAREHETAPVQKLIVIGFMGGNVRPNNFVHREAQLTQTLQAEYPATMDAEIFANRHGQQAFNYIIRQLGKTKAALLSQADKSAARIVIFGHSWGASETVALANRLNTAGIPVLLTIQVDSVQKQRQNDAEIPPNVHEAVNFYQAEGMLRGRDRIVAADPNRTKILGNYLSSYRQNHISCAGFPWYARAFMKPHVQIENDPAVWNHIQDLIVAKAL